MLLPWKTIFRTGDLPSDVGEMSPTSYNDTGIWPAGQIHFFYCNWYWARIPASQWL